MENAYSGWPNMYVKQKKETDKKKLSNTVYGDDATLSPNDIIESHINNYHGWYKSILWTAILIFYFHYCVGHVDF